MIEQTEFVTTPLTTVITNMKHLKAYAVSFCSDLQPILDVMNANNMHTEHFGSFLDSTDSAKEKFTSIQTAQSTLSISSLEVNCFNDIVCEPLYNPLTDLYRNLKKLTSLKIKCQS